MGKKVEYKQNLKGIGVTGSNVDVIDVKVPSGYKRTLQSISCENETTAFTYLRIGYDRDGTKHWWVEQKSPSLGTLYWLDDPKVLEEGDILTCRFNGTVDDDVLATYVDGFTEKV